MSAPDGGHVLVVGVDGVRFDFLGPEGAPSVWALGRAGFLAPVRVDEATPTWSGPCWATIATGTGVAGHGITGNDLTGHRLAPLVLAVAGGSLSSPGPRAWWPLRGRRHRVRSAR
ncbi:MAG TPA: alkaline phosphatase family protein, partial [Streptosporangiaceae bacterium]|nr:alkaline phosphatase family protein [Streptosporangiaceae bacterium]